MRSLLLSLAVICGLAVTARAQDFEAAGKHFSAAQEAFGARRYKTAAAEFEAAYGITKDPVLLYNIAESWEKAGDGKQAVGNYRQYLREQPSAQDKAEVLKRVKAIEAKHYRLIDQSAPDDKPPADSGSTAPVPLTPSTPPTPSPAAPAPSAATTLPNAPTTPAPATPPAAGTETPPPVASTAPTTGALPPAAPPPPSPTSAPAPEGATPGAASNAPAPAPTSVTPSAETPPPPGIMDEGPMSKMRVGAWIGVASTLALLTAGAIFGLAAESRADEINRNLSYVNPSGMPNKFDLATNDTLHQLKSDGELYNGLAIGFYSAAAASAVATVVLFVVDAKRPRKSSHALNVAPFAGHGVAGVGLGGRF